MKKKLFKLVTLFASIAILTTGCADDNSNSPSSDNQVSVPTFGGGKIIKNSVVVNESTDSYVEYLEFTSDIGGNYYVYKNGEKISSFNEKEISKTFSYNPETGEVTCGDVSAYMFSTKKDSETVSAFSKDRMIPADSEKGLYTTWTGNDTATPTIIFEIDKDDNQTLQIAQKDVIFTPSFERESGWITVKGITTDLVLYHSSNNFLFYRVYISERSEVNEVGRALILIEEFNSEYFILLK
ncbi:MAG: hypothetical protein HDR57_04730 [Treponema sp.]|nr:hypothetical protein [Treponema sp.]